MSSKYKFRNPDAMYFVSFSVVYWIDVFIRHEYKQVLIDSWSYCQKHKSLRIHAWCIMSSHVHMIISSDENHLANIMRDMKSYTSRKLKSSIIHHPKESRKKWMLEMMYKAGKKNGNNIDFQFWQQNNHPIELYNNFMIDQKLEYLHNNPVKAEFVYAAEQYPYSSACDYHGIKGFLEIELIE